VPGEKRRGRLRALLENAGVSAALLERVDAAFVHPSAARERDTSSNERLEFLGDAVLGFTVARWLYVSFPDDSEGLLARRKAAIVSDLALAASARRLGFSDLVELGTGERASGGAQRSSILADAFEAFLAALYLHAGMDAVAQFVERMHIGHTDFSAEAILDPKTSLQEFTQQHYACMPRYREEGQGPDHQRRFTSFVCVKGELLGTGSGVSKKAAQQEAAAQAFAVLHSRQGSV